MIGTQISRMNALANSAILTQMKIIFMIMLLIAETKIKVKKITQQYIF